MSDFYAFGFRLDPFLSKAMCKQCVAGIFFLCGFVWTLCLFVCVQGVVRHPLLRFGAQMFTEATPRVPKEKKKKS